MNSFMKTGEQNFSNQVSYGVYNGKNVFSAPVHAGNDIVMIDPAFSKFRWNPSILLHTFALAIEFFLTALFGIFLSLPIIRNLRKLLEGIERVRQNDLDARVDIPLNKPIGTLARCFNDMAERIQSLLEHQKHLIQAVAHEIRTPISRIHFHLEMLVDADDKAEIDHRAKDIEGEIEELNRLINELSMLSTLKQPKKDLEIIGLQAHDVLSEVVAYYQKSNIQIEIILLDTSGESLEISANPVYFKRAIHNIVSNAVRHAKSKVTVRCDTSSDTILIKICDDGPGIPQHARSIVFEPFTRIDNSRSRHSGGFGLGLAIVDRIVSLHGGKVTIGDNPPRGACITTWWPNPQAADAQGT
jgi:signal transduction histidine kinase